MFLFEGHTRWSWPWTSPNHLGAFVAMLIPFLWSAHCEAKRRRTIAGLWLAEAAAAWVLCKTYSRGSLVALVVAAGLYLIYAGAGRWRGVPLKASVPWFARALALATFLLAAQFNHRVSPGYIAGDGAVVHRLEIWRGGLAMIRASPLAGWGRDLGAVHYLNWYQPIDAGYTVNNLVSGVLQLAVEFGLPAFVVVMTAVFALVVAPALERDERGKARRSAPWVRACGAAVGAFATGNIFSTLSPAVSLDVLFLLACAAEVVLCRPCAGARVRIAAVATAAALSCATGAWILGGRIIGELPVSVGRLEGGDIVLGKSNAGPPQHYVYFVPDGEVLGGYPGQSIRQMLGFCPDDVAIVVCAGAANFRSTSHRDIVIFGRAVNFVASGDLRRLFLVHPIAGAPMEFPKVAMAVLPAVDELNQNPYWTHQAELILHSPNVGTDIRPALSLVTPILIHAIVTR